MFEHNRRRLAREIGLAFGWLAALALLLMLASYSPDDPGWSVADRRDEFAADEVQNGFGLFGAYVADILFAAVGNTAFLLALIMFAVFYALLRGDSSPAGESPHHSPKKSPPPSRMRDASVCASGVLLFVAASSGLERLHFSSYAAGLPSGAGGGAGHLVADGARAVFGETGAIAVLLFVWAVSLSMAASLSWFGLCEKLGELAERWFWKSMEQAARLHQSWRARQMARRRRASAPGASGMPSRPELRLTPAARPPVGGAGRAKEPFFKKKESPPPPAQKETPEPAVKKAAAMPSLELLDLHQGAAAGVQEDEVRQNSEIIEQTLRNFGVTVTVTGVHPGPVITRYDIQPDEGVKGAQIVNLMRDIARALSVAGIRVLETIPGTKYMGLEIPNHRRDIVYLEELFKDEAYASGRHALPLALGKDATGRPAVADLANMPHLLVAGATGSGKSVCVNAMLLSLLFALPPERLRMILIDPKMLELASYHDIPHLWAPVITDVGQAPAALAWTVEEMESRYRLMSRTGARNIDSYNRLASKNGDGRPAVARVAAADGADELPQPLPYLVVVIDELADLMMTTGKKVEMLISRLAQKARAAGIHLILATQRPSVDVITGLIKANIPSRIAFQVASKVDSRTIIDQMGADMLLGKGDMLYLPSGSGTPARVHGAFVSDDEVGKVAAHWRRSGPPQYEMDFAQAPVPGAGGSPGTPGMLDGDDEDARLYEQALEAVLSSGRPSISMVQRKLRIGYNRAARLVEAMEEAGVVSAADETGARKILVRSGGGGEDG